MTNEDPISLPDKIINVTQSLEFESLDEVHQKLFKLINELINKDFESLIQLLYRIDVNEKKIRLYLNQKPNEDSANVLAGLIIERQLQKIETRKKFKSKNSQEKNEERW
jgi:hypothetical protein